ncbi:hypothetical protein EZV62_008826 [Acer yangbiense]|uniref:Uncharacterized protein n=1 Tax=Acer yangbiense TaxID=1000413 RepID=A0A5C7IEH1_9ROSI|nr:hypothetical protein EZV62_008826 [Acer yangbiense]
MPNDEGRRGFATAEITMKGAIGEYDVGIMGKCMCGEAFRMVRVFLSPPDGPSLKVAISTGCPCAQLEVKLAYDGFQTVEAIDSLVLAKSGGECLVNNGQPIFPNKDFSFTYAWDTSFQFKTLSSQVACS